VSRYDHPLPPSEAARRRQDPVADLDALHPRPYGENPADAFIPDDGRKRGAECIDALCDHEVVRVDRGKLDADHDLVQEGSVGLGNLDILETVDRVAKSCELNSAHIHPSFYLKQVLDPDRQIAGGGRWHETPIRRLCAADDDEASGGRSELAEAYRKGHLGDVLGHSRRGRTSSPLHAKTRRGWALDW
jgi:hypothetical protein